MTPQPQQQEYFLVEGDELTDLMAFGCTPDAPVLKAITNRRFNPVPPPGLPDNYWYCPFRVGCEEGESWCSWPCDKWANWHDAARDAQALSAAHIKLRAKASQRQMDVETEDGTIIEVIEKGEVLAWIDEMLEAQR